MLINFSNHPSKNWSEKQISEAKSKYVEVKDIPFPFISPHLSENEITDLSQNYVNNILKRKPKAVHIMGEMNFIYKCINLLKMYGITCLASTTERDVIEEDGNKFSTFKFVQFREY
jgi:hypothetical protein